MKRYFLGATLLVVFSVSLFSFSMKEVNKKEISETTILFLNDIVTQDTFYVQTPDCGGTAGVCVDIPFSDIGNYSFVDNGGMYSNGFDSCMIGTSLNLGVGTHWIQIVENGGTACVDSFYVNVLCVQTSTEVFEIEENSSHQYCFDFGELLAQQPSTTEILCPSNPGTPVDFNLIGGNNCVSIIGASIGQDTACYAFCDNFGICDTTYLYVNVIPQASNITIAWIYDTMFVNTTNQLCIDTSELNGNVVNITNGCPMQSGEFAVFNIDTTTYCLDYSGIDIGIDTACIYVTDDLGNIDTTFIVAYVSNPITDTLYQDINLGDFGEYCIDTTELGGNIVVIENLCGNSGAGGVAVFTLNNQTTCFDALGNSVGQDTACISICDNFGTCDTTILIANVLPAQPIDLVANDDIDTVIYNETLYSNICDNDLIPNNFLTNYYILPTTFGGVGPNEGTVAFDGECNIIYTPFATDCDIVDEFNYVICNVDGCDTALYTVFISCETTTVGGPLEFANGFSPNGDEVNQFFTIKGAEDFPNNILRIYNRWGNEVYRKEGYTNDWDGLWKGTSLQNGTYFYLFNDGAGNTYSGYVYLQR